MRARRRDGRGPARRRHPVLGRPGGDGGRPLQHLARVRQGGRVRREPGHEPQRDPNVVRATPGRRHLQPGLPTDLSDRQSARAGTAHRQPAGQCSRRAVLLLARIPAQREGFHCGRHRLLRRAWRPRHALRCGRARGHEDDTPVRPRQRQVDPPRRHELRPLVSEPCHAAERRHIRGQRRDQADQARVSQRNPELVHQRPANGDLLSVLGDVV